ncbi:MAG: EAL domain-containing protein [Mariniblastus sp.]
MPDSTLTTDSSLDRLQGIIANLQGYLEESRELEISGAVPSTLNSISDAVEQAAKELESAKAKHSRLPSDLADGSQQNASDSTKAFVDTILEHTQDGFVVLEKYHSVANNYVALSLFGCDQQTIDEYNFLRIVSANFEVDADWPAAVMQLLENDSIVEQEIKRISVDESAEDFWCELTLRKSVVDGRDQVFVTARDISRRKEYEFALARNRDFLHNTINAVPEPLSVKSANLDIVLVNDSFCETHNVRREDVVGKSAELVLPGTRSPQMVQRELDVLETGKKQAALESFLDDDQQQVILSTYRCAFLDQASGEPYMVASSRDVTTEMKRENRLRLLASVFENAQEGVAILSTDGAICEANPEFIATIGKTHQAVLGMCLSTVVNCEPHNFSEIIAVAQEGRPWFGNVKMINKRHEEIACWLSLSPSKNLRGESTNLIAMFSDITQIEHTKRELRRQALHDNLTDLPNRRFYRNQISDLIASDVSGDLRFGVSFLDLDDFKIVNDTLGHDAGDRLLVEVSKRVKSTLGSDCFLARFGGDEFALLIPEEKGAALRAHECSRAVVEALGRPFDLSGHEVHIGVSIGTTIYPDHATDVESLMRHADVAMYKAKEEGKNKVTFFSSELVEIVEKKQAMLTELRQALENGDLNVVYQPKMCLKTNRINSCEALVRWTKPDGAVVSPSEFIPIAEDFGLIAALGHQVLKTVCLQARIWYDEGILCGPIAVNLSPRQLKEANFIERLKLLMEESQIQPEWIELEITENAVMEDRERALRMMHQINELGVSIAIDDFGTGYSSLSYIRDFPIRTLKIDTSFIKNLPECTRAVAIAHTVLSLGHGLDLKVVAEGVETPEQLKFLRDAGCDMVQGYYVSRPVTAIEFSEFIGNQ